MITAVSYGVISVAQFTLTAIFLYRSREIKEIRWLPKTMMITATLSSMFYTVFYSNFYLKWNKLAFIILDPVVKIAMIVNYGLLFRFVWLQVQLKAAEENSKKIMADIQKS